MESTVSMEPKDKVTNILNQVSELSESEKLVLYLKLPDVADELSRDPPTQMSERSNLALSWIRTHYMEDREMFVPKQDVYEQYRQYCESAGNNPVSSGDFGKVMKLVFPHVHHRRLGQRGQSKYFYKGLKRKENIDTSSPTEVLSDVRTKLNLNLLALSCQLVCEWAMQLLGRPFADIRNLSEYLVSKGLSCGKTAAKFSLLSGSTSPPKLFDRDRKSPNWKHHERQVLLQRKLQHNELIREHKEKLKQQQQQLREQQSTSTALGRSSLTPDACSVKGAEAVTVLVAGIPGRKILPRPLSVQPYVQKATSYGGKKQDILSFSHGRYFEKASPSRLSTVASGVKTSQVTPGRQGLAADATHLMEPTSLMDIRESDLGQFPPKRCHSTSVVERQSSSLLYGLLELTEQTLDRNQRTGDRNLGCDMDDDKGPGFSSPAGSCSTRTDAHVVSPLSEAVSKGLSSSSSLVPHLANAQTNITTLCESPGLRLSADGLLMPQHPKRYGDNISPDRSSLTKRKCTTSLGVTKPQSLETSVGADENANSDINRSRPYSCPVSTDSFPFDSFGKEGKSLSHNLFAEFVHSRDAGKVTLTNEAVLWAEAAHSPTLGPDQKTKDDKKKIRPEQPKKATSLCHFVQKPTVINRPQRVLHPVSSCSDPNQEAPSIAPVQAPPESNSEKQSYNILNSLLSSNYETMSDSVSSLKTLPALPFTSPLTSSFICTSTTALASKAILSGSQLRLATNTSHTVESPSILSSLSSRSAFVPVTSHKLQVAHSNLRENEPVTRIPVLQKQLTELVPKDQELVAPSVPVTAQSLSNDCTQPLLKPALSHTLARDSSNDPTESSGTASVTFSNYGTTTTSNSSSSSSSSSTLCRSGESMSSGCESLLTTPVPAAAALSEKSDEPPHSTVPVKNIPTSGFLVCNPVLQEKSSSFVERSTPGVSADTCQTGSSFQTHTTTSPITPTKRASRNRFTPIRPKLQGSTSTPSPQKLGAMTTPSPQKKDMRSVSTILKEQRMKCAQDLLVNLANSYQGNVKLQLPAELLGLSTGGKMKHADVCVTIRSPNSSGNICQPKNTQIASSDLNRQLWPLKSPTPPHKEITVVVEPVPQSPIHSTLSPALSSCLISSTPTQLLPNLQQPVGVHLITHNTVVPKPLFSPTTATQAHSSHSTPVSLPSAGSGAKLIILPASLPSLPSTQVVEPSPHKPIIVEDDRGNKYSLDHKSMPTILPHNLQTFLDTNQTLDSVKAPSDTNTSYIGGTSSILNVSEMNAHVIGPDSNGQTYLLVPNSEPLPASTDPGSLCQQTSPAVATTAPMATVSRSQVTALSGVPCPSVLIQPAASSSSALLSELSQLASSRQALIQHNSGISAFHKCSSTQRRTDSIRGSGEADGIVRQTDPSPGQPSDCHLVEKTLPGLLEDIDGTKKQQGTAPKSSETQTSEGAPQVQGVRKRKASNGQEGEHEDRKRLNSLRHQKKDDDNDDDVFIVKIEDRLGSNPGSESLEAESGITAKSQNSGYVFSPKSGLAHNNAQCEGKLVSAAAAGNHNDSQKIVLDTETLLGMIEDSKSMTVKETIRALNELRAKHLHNGNKSYSCTEIDGSEKRTRPTVQASVSCQEMGLCSQAPAANSAGMSSGSHSHHRSVVVSRSQSARCNSVSPFKLGDSSLCSTAHQETDASSYTAVHKGERTGRRHISLNLESLESDALLDTEPALDHRLVGDIRDITSARSDQKTSIGVAVKTAKSKSLRLLSDQTSDSKTRPKQLRQDIKSSKTTLLNDKKDLDKVFSSMSKKETDSGFLSDKTNDQNNADLLMCSNKRKQSSKNSQKNPAEILPELTSDQRRSMSCVHDMLHGNKKQSFVTYPSTISDTKVPISSSQNVKSFSLTDIYQPGDSKVFDQTLQTHSLSVSSAGLHEEQVDGGHSPRVKADPRQPSAGQNVADAAADRCDSPDNELPGDIADFITESMSAGNAYNCSAFKGNTLTTLLADLVRNGQNDREPTLDGQNSTMWRSVSVPNTVTNTYYEYKMEHGQPHHETTSESMPVSYLKSWSTTNLEINPNIGDEQVQDVGSKDEGIPDAGEADHFLSVNPEMGKVKDYSSDHSSQLSDGCLPLSSATFLSPIGPAKSNRRSSVERSSSGDRTLTKTPVESSSLKSAVDKSLPRTRTPTDRTQIKASGDRSHAKTPVDKSLTMTSVDKVSKRISRVRSPSNPRVSRDHTASAILQKLVKERDPHRQPVNRVLAKSPAEKVLSNFVYESLFTNQAFDHVIHSTVGDGGKDDRSHNQTPVSDAGYSSVSQTPLSDVGDSSVSPSPVMMSLPGLFGECGRQELTSPATIFMPVRSDSVLSVVNNSGRTGDGAEVLTSQMGSQGGSRSVLNWNRCLQRNSEVDDYDRTDGEQTLFSQDFIGRDSSVPHDGAEGHLLDAGGTKSNAQLRALKSHIFRESSFRDVDRFVQLNCIPTPPHSPSTSPQQLTDTSRSPLSSQNLPPTRSHQSLVAPICSVSSHQGMQFSSVTTSTSHVACLSSNNFQHITSSPGFGSCAGYQSPNAPPEHSRSPYSISHPCSSPHQYNPHPSPPFTPSSQRCLASPRCPTPCSHRSLMSPRCATPCGDLNSAPNRFMPIQTSGILTTPLTATQTYIQPIRPVVTLASMANQNNRNSPGLSRLEHFTRLPISKTFPRLTEASILDLLRRDIDDHNTLHQPTTTNIDMSSNTDKLKTTTLSVDCDAPPCHRKVKTRQKVQGDHKPERSSHPGLILSLTGGIGSVSRQGMQTGWVPDIPNPNSPSSVTKTAHGRSVASYHSQPTHYFKPKSGRVHPEVDQVKSPQFTELSKPNEKCLSESGRQTSESSSQRMATNASDHSFHSHVGENVSNHEINSDSPAVLGVPGKNETEHKKVSLSQDSNKPLLSHTHIKPSAQKENEQFYTSNFNYPTSRSADLRCSPQLAKHGDRSETSSREQKCPIQDNKVGSCGPSQFSFQRPGADSGHVDTTRKSSLSAMLQAPPFTAGQILHAEANISSTESVKPKSFHQISDLPTAHYSGTAPNVDLTKASFALCNLPAGVTSRSDSGTAPNVDLTKASFSLAGLPAGFTHGPTALYSRSDSMPAVYFVSLDTSSGRQTEDYAAGNQDELDETLSILKNLDSQYFQQDDGSSSSKDSN